MSLFVEVVLSCEPSVDRGVIQLVAVFESSAALVIGGVDDHDVVEFMFASLLEEQRDVIDRDLRAIGS